MPAISGSVVIVTGASSGIGFDTALALAELGAKVVCVARRRDRLDNLVKRIRSGGGEALPITADITNRAEMKQVVERSDREFGAVHSVVAIAGLDAPPGLAWEIDEEHWRTVIDVDLTGAWWTVSAALSVMMRQRQGRIVLTSSVAARVGSEFYSPAYSAAKAGLLGLTVSLAVQLEPYGILVNAIAPGPTGNTGTPASESESHEYLSTHPLGFGGTAPIVDGVVYLLGATGDWLSGTVLNVSGGAWRGV